VATGRATFGRSGVLLERQQELRRLDSLLIALRDRRGEVALIEGPAGIGKTVLLDVLASRASVAGTRILRARGGELERDDPFGVVAQLFGPPLRPEELRNLPVAAQAALGATEGAIAPPGEDAARTIYHGLYTLCVRLAAGSPLLILVDDAHWADERSLRWLLFLARRVDHTPIAIALAHRSREPGSEQGLISRLATQDGAELIELAPLTVAATSELVRATLGADADGRFCDACHRATGGNPFLLGALVTELRASGVQPTAESAEVALAVGPQSVARATLLRLSRAPAAATGLARAIAVLEDAELSDAARLAELDERTAATAAAALAEVGLLAPGRRLRFAHPLVRAAIYADIDEREQLLLHRAAASALAVSEAAPERVAAHLMNALPADDLAAVTALRAAARRTYASGAPDASARYLRRALAERPDGRERAEVLLELGRAEVRANEPEAVGHLTQSVDAAGDDQTLQARALRELGRAHILTGRMAEAIAAFERAVAAAGEDRELRLALEGELGATLANVTNAADVAARLASYRDLAGTTPAERTVLALQAFVAIQQNEPAEVANALIDRALVSGEFVAEQTAGSITFADGIFSAILAEREPLCLELLIQGRADAERLGWSTALAAVPFFEAFCHLRLGQLEPARSRAHASLAIADERGWHAFTPMAAAILCMTELERGQLDAAATALERLGLSGEIPDSALFQLALYARGLLRAAQGELATAHADLLLCGEREIRLGGITPAAMAWRSQAALVRARMGDADGAQQLAAEEVALAQTLGTPRALGVALRAAAIVTGGRAGIDPLTDAVRVLKCSGATLEQARALCDLGAALRRDNRRRAARAPLAEALALASACGAEALAARAKDELLAAGSRPRRTALRGPDALTASERRVAELAAAGRANREIADELVVTVRTVEFHLSRAYAKLGVRSRAALHDALNGQHAQAPAPAARRRASGRSGHGGP
jgi:DNA-binding CsgD family transcriptional regulator